MEESVAVVGAGVSGLTCSVLFAELGRRTTVFARERGQHTTSGAAAAIWFPYDAEPVTRVIEWSLATFAVLRKLASEPASGVSMIELRVFARAGELPIPGWAERLGARRLETAAVPKEIFTSGYAVEVPLLDTTIYLDYLAARFMHAGGRWMEKTLATFDDVPSEHALIINCTGAGAKQLVPDPQIEPHRGQVAIIAKLDLPYAIVCDDPPLMYAIPRRKDCVLGGSNEISEKAEPRPAETSRILAEASRVLGCELPPVISERVGLRPFRRSGIRLEAEQIGPARTVIHNYGHGGSGFTLSWGCAESVLELSRKQTSQGG